jgi:CRISPR/Cas system-associated exonuclease Cas4 (RecB family)
MDRYLQLRERAAAFVAEFAPTGPVLVLANHRDAAAEVARAACATALLDIRQHGFRDLVQELAEEPMARRALTPIGRIVREALAAQVAAAADLTYLKPVAAFPGFPRALAATLEELRLNRVAPADLRDCGRSGPDLASLLAAYESALHANAFADHAHRVRLALDHARLPETAVVVLDLVPRTTLEQELLATLLRWARVAEDLRLAAPAPALLPTPEPPSALASLQRYLFSADPVPARPPDGSFDLFSTSGEALECVEIARRILHSGVPFDDAAILLRGPERHQPLVVEALRRAGIPAHCAHGTAQPDPAGRAFLALLLCATENLSASRFAEYLSLGQMREDEEPHTPAVWERLLVDAAVIGGPDRWRTRLQGLRREFAQRYRLDPDPALERRAAALDNLGETALPIIDRLAALPSTALWGDWLDALAGIAEFTLRDPERVLELLDQLAPLSALGPVALSDILFVLSPRLTVLRPAPKEARYGRVWIGGIEESRGMTFRHVYVPGINEGLFPRPPAEDPLLWQAQRQSLGIQLRADDAELLHVAAACASERLTLSFSRLDLLTGRERVPSFYAFAAWRAAGGPDLDVRQFEARARAATETKIGWPAPHDPACAIDDAEFDLATLAPRAPGSGQYLKRLDRESAGRAVEALRVRWTRWHKSWKAADGLLIEEIGDDALKPHTLAARPWSPSSLQEYARCPYRFALQTVFGLRPAERPEAIQRLAPATRGEIYHEIQFQLLRDHPADPADHLDAVADAVAAEWRDKLAPAIPQVWNSEIAALKADLHGWLDHRRETAADWTPIHAELSFGLPDPTGRDPHSRRDPVRILDGGVLLRGSIDLVERHASGILRVVDHKTGRPPDPRPDMVGAGEVLQPALYALAAEQLLGEEVAEGHLYYATVARNYEIVPIKLNQWTRHRAAQALKVIDDALRDGFLPAAPRKDACKGCDYLPICGPYEEERAALKDQTRLGPLKELRKWR